MFNSNSSMGGVVNGLYYLERILDIIIRLFNALTGKSTTTKPETTAPETTTTTPVE